ncbi:uncharacterized protein LOC102388632 isoform X2 [Alligator sinensis]|uniref:Uncharacterized protein LOC102388632 isoform X2 n=1 Tax=Alligator sinensis TaxID=38654 RepID=A0A3Q0HIQ5_ALLSI|nr:uncharacterized protein LOC102388632 isoform X2 [Alligator sinensis]
MEVASFLSDKASTISVVEKEAVPFQEALGPQVGGVAMKMLQGRGVKFYMKSQVSELRGEDGKVAEAILDSGKKLPADVVVVGIAHEDQRLEGLCCRGCGCLPGHAAGGRENWHLPLAGGSSTRSRGRAEHAEEAVTAAHRALLLDRAAREQHPLRRLWERLHRDSGEGKPGGAEVCDLLHQGRLRDRRRQPEVRPHGRDGGGGPLRRESHLQGGGRGLLDSLARNVPDREQIKTRNQLSTQCHLCHCAHGREPAPAAAPGAGPRGALHFLHPQPTPQGLLQLPARAGWGGGAGLSSPPSGTVLARCQAGPSQGSSSSST